MAPLFAGKSGVVSSGVAGHAGRGSSTLRLASRLTGLALLAVAGMLAVNDPLTLTLRHGALIHSHPPQRQRQASRRTQPGAHARRCSLALMDGIHGVRGRRHPGLV
jgi:hypothetical protein